MTKPKDFKTLLAGARLPERTLAVDLGGVAYDFRLRALPASKFRKLIAATKDNAAVPAAVIRATVVDPELTDEEAADLLDEKLTDHQFELLFTAAWQINRGPVSARPEGVEQ